MTTHFTISVRGSVYGPVPEDQLKEDIMRGWLKPQTYFWDEKGRKWLPVLDHPLLYEIFFRSQELELAHFKDPLNPNRKVYLTNRRLVVTPSSGKLDSALDSARRWLGSKLPDEVVQIPWEGVKGITFRTTNIPLTETVEVGVEYLLSGGQSESLNLVLYPADRGPFQNALRNTRRSIPVQDQAREEEQLRRARGVGKVEIKNVAGDLVQKKVESKTVDQRTNITDSIITRSQVGTDGRDIEGEDRKDGMVPQVQKSSTCQACGKEQDPTWKRCPFCLE